MSKQAITKLAIARVDQGYTREQHTCATCAELVFRVEERPVWGAQGETYKMQKDLRCGLGGFAVKKTATCRMWRLKEEER